MQIYTLLASRDLQKHTPLIMPSVLQIPPQAQVQALIILGDLETAIQVLLKIPRIPIVQPELILFVCTSLIPLLRAVVISAIRLLLPDAVLPLVVTSITTQVAPPAPMEPGIRMHQTERLHIPIRGAQALRKPLLQLQDCYPELILYAQPMRTGALPAV